MRALRRRSRRRAGLALVAVLAWMAFVLPLLALVAREMALSVAQRAEVPAGLQAFYTADAGLAWARSVLASRVWYSRLVGGGDPAPVAGGAELPFPVDPPAFFPKPPYRFGLGVRLRAKDRAEIVARGLGPRGVMAALVLAVRRDPRPFVPAAIVTVLPPASVSVDPNVTVTAPGAREIGFAGGGVPAPGSPDGAVGFPGTEDLAAQLERVGPPSLLPAEAEGSFGPGLFASRGPVLAGSLVVEGVALLRGDLRVERRLHVRGLLIVAGDLWTAHGCDVRIEGLVVQGGEARSLRLAGSGQVRLDWEAIGIVERLAPGVLPRRVRVDGWRFDDPWPS